MSRRGLLLLLALAGIGRPAAPGEPYAGEVSVTLRYVDVVVTDREGEPITDLAAGDFELLEDGSAREVVDFYVRDLTDGAAADPARGEWAASREERPWVVVLLDVKHMVMGELDRPKRAIRKLLGELLVPGTMVSVMVLRHHIEVVADFTDDLATIPDRVDDVLWWKPDGELAEKLPEAGDGASGEGSSSLRVSLFPRYAMLGPDHSLFSVLEGLGASMGRLRGPKTIVLFSEGIASSPADTRVADAYTRMVTTLNGASVSVISVDAEGLRGRLGRSDRLFRALPQINLLGGRGKAGLRAVARETGGAALIGSSNMAGFIGETLASRRVSYVLGYHPADGGAAGYRALEVKVKRRGAKVTARGGVPPPRSGAEPTPEERRAALDEAMASWVLPADLPLSLRAAAFPISGKESLAVLAVELPGRALAGNDRHRIDLAGGLVESASRNVHGFSVSADEPASGPVAERTCVLRMVRLPFGSYVAKVVAQSAGEALLGAVEARIDVPRQTKIGPLLSHVALLDPAYEGAIHESGFDAEPGAAPLFLHQGRRLAPAFHGFREGAMAVVGYGVWGLARSRQDGATHARITQTIWQGERRIRDSRRELTGAGGEGALLAAIVNEELSLEGLEAGDYEVEVRVEDLVAEKQALRRAPLHVVAAP